jgi:hypothetical protein
MHGKVESFMVSLELQFAEVHKTVEMILMALRGDLATTETGLRGAVEMIRRDIHEIQGQITGVNSRLRALEQAKASIEKSGWDILVRIIVWTAPFAAAAILALIGYEKWLNHVTPLLP